MANVNPVRYVLCKGMVNKNARVSYSYRYSSEGEFSTVRSNEKSTWIYPAFSVNISEGYDMPAVFIPASQYFMFVALFHKSLLNIQAHIHELYPNMNQDEFEMDSLMLERYLLEKAMNVGGMSIVPSKWVDPTNKCYPAMKIENAFGSCTIPIEDCISFDQMFMSFDPNTFGLIMLNMVCDDGGG